MATRCPACFVALSPQVLAFRCRTKECGEVRDDVASRYTGVAMTGRPVMSADPGSLGTVCSSCNNGTDLHVCPKCHFDLPPNWRGVVTTCIAMAGARTSGKSIYIAVLKKEAELLAKRMGGVLTYGDASTTSNYPRYYEKPLYEQRGLMPATISSLATGDSSYHRNPLIFNLGVIGGVMRSLVVRDVAGEDLEETRTDLDSFAFFRDADAVLFLFDPMAIDSIRKQLSGLIMEERQEGADPLIVLDNLIRMMRNGDVISATLVPTPLGVVLNKFDTMLELTKVEGGTWGPIMRNPGAAFNRDSSVEVAAFQTEDAALLQAEVQSLLVGLGAEGLMNRVDALFPNRQLFAVSALGSKPVNQETASARGVAPFRVLDPVKWAMYRSGALGSG